MIDEIGVIEAESKRLLAAWEVQPTGRVPWSEKWTVATCARHVGGTHHVVAQVVADRPTADFGRFASLTMPKGDDPGLGAWLAEGTQALVSALRATDPEAECWSWWPEGRTAGFWRRRMAQETLVHRWDAEAGAGVHGAPMDPAVAADGVDEYLDIFVSTSRAAAKAPAGPTFHLCATDTRDEWWLRLPSEGEREVVRTVPAHAVSGQATLRGQAEDLLLTAWGRLTPAAAGVAVGGDVEAVAHWADYCPPM
jgi:uncharacterized protein (TIGR03083 family)